jgi:hypothetical protein
MKHNSLAHGVGASIHAQSAKAAPDNSTCLAAMQVIGHHGESVVKMSGQWTTWMIRNSAKQ